MLAFSHSTCLKETRYRGQNSTHGIRAAILTKCETGHWRTPLVTWSDQTSALIDDRIGGNADRDLIYNKNNFSNVHLYHDG
jgi:hypothetical protein